MHWCLTLQRVTGGQVARPQHAPHHVSDIISSMRLMLPMRCACQVVTSVDPFGYYAAGVQQGLDDAFRPGGGGGAGGGAQDDSPVAGAGPTSHPEHPAPKQLPPPAASDPAAEDAPSDGAVGGVASAENAAGDGGAAMERYRSAEGAHSGSGAAASAAADNGVAGAAPGSGRAGDEGMAGGPDAAAAPSGRAFANAAEDEARRPYVAYWCCWSLSSSTSCYTCLATTAVAGHVIANIGAANLNSDVLDSSIKAVPAKPPCPVAAAPSRRQQ